MYVIVIVVYSYICKIFHGNGHNENMFMIRLRDFLYMFTNTWQRATGLYTYITVHNGRIDELSLYFLHNTDGHRISINSGSYL